MNLYEVIFHSSYGKVDGDADTIYLVSAPDFKSAVDVVTRDAKPSDHGGKHFPLADAVYEIGIKASCEGDAVGTRILRGPYIQCAYNYCWKSWRRKVDGSKMTDEWDEKPYVVGHANTTPEQQQGRIKLAREDLDYMLAHRDDIDPRLPIVQFHMQRMQKIFTEPDDVRRLTELSGYLAKQNP